MEMKLMPTEDVTLVTNLSKEDVCLILKENLQEIPKITFFERKNQKLFEGSLQNDRFEIQRTTNVKDLFLPKITGVISTGIRNTAINLNFKPYKNVLIFINICFGLIVCVLIATIIGAYLGEIEAWSIIPIVIMLVLGIKAVVYGINLEIKKAKNELIKLFKAKVEETKPSQKSRK
ncbi:hypothetical protein ACV07N_14050 [Roseivirga echinicomitans]